MRAWVNAVAWTRTAWLSLAGGLVLSLLALPALAQDLAKIPPLDSPVVDTTGTLDAAQREQLVQQAQALQQRKGSQLQVLIVPSTQPEDIAPYTQRVFDLWKLGRKGIDDGVLLVVAKDDRRVRIQPGYGLEGAIPDAIANRIIQEYMAPRFRAGDYAGGIAESTAMLVKLIDGEPLPEPVADNPAGHRGQGGSGWLVALFVGFVAASIARGIFAAAPRPIRALLSGVAAGGAALLLTSLFFASGLAGLIGLVLGLSSGTPGRFVRHGGWGGWGGGGFGGGGWGGGGGGGFGGGGGWGGGGGSSGGGGASGSW